jgi:hypothetical protein
MAGTLTNAGTVFHSDFYVVAATVLPVLYIALVLPGGALSSMTTTLRGQYVALPPTKSFVRKNFVAFSLLVAAVHVAFLVGEEQALEALATWRADSVRHGFVLWCALVLVVSVAVLGTQHAVTSFISPQEESSAKAAERNGENENASGS